MSQPLDPGRWQRVAAILGAALELTPPARAVYLEGACGDDDALRREVEALLAADQAAGAGFLSGPAVERAAPLVADAARARHPAAPDSASGRTVGPYRLIGELGEGGMGVVWLAERVDGQFEQRVAIKFVRHGLQGDEAGRRFLQERQILARLQHPAIARLLDGGVTHEGTPFFVMEWVQGRPITTYCADVQMGVDDRLRLFLQVCEAVQYAHRNLIVHRDLKPSNILVDDAGGVKLLDFGVAKLLGDGDARPAGSAPTILRAFTPEYAAPEQLRGEPVSTSTDVYALGVLLYELLAGVRPHAARATAAYAIERAILEDRPAPPSARVGAAVGRRLKGDLDRIVLKALEMPPDRRYASAEAFASDVRRHLEGLPVSARGNALTYRARKFLGRHRLGAGAALLLLVTLAGGLIATIWQAGRAEREARKADAVKEFLKSLFSAADPASAQGREPSVRQLLDAGAARIETDLRGQPDVQSEVARLIAAVYHALGQYDRAVPLLTGDLERRRRIDGAGSVAVAELLTQIADARYEQARYDEAGAMYREALTIQQRARGDRAPQVAELLWDIAGVARNRGDLPGAEALEKQALAIYVETRGAESAEAAGLRESLAITYMQGGRFADALALEEPVASWRERRYGADHPDTLNARYNVAYVLTALGRYDEAIRLTEDVVARQRRVLGDRHDRLAVSLRLLARALDGAGRAEAALAPIGEALAVQTAEFGAAHLQVATDRAWQASIESHAGRLADAERDGRTALAFFDAATSPGRADLPTLRTAVGLVLADAGRIDEAGAQISRAAAELRALHQEGPFLGMALDALGDVALRRRQAARAVELTRDAVAILEHGLGPDHPATAMARVHHGAALWANGDAGRGEQLIRAGLVPLEARFPAGHPDLAAARILLGELLAGSGRGAQARPLLQSALSWRDQHFGPTDPRTVMARTVFAATEP